MNKTTVKIEQCFSDTVVTFSDSSDRKTIQDTKEVFRKNGYRVKSETKEGFKLILVITQIKR